MKTNNIVIVGGGSAGWMAAASLIKAFPNKSISVIESADVPTIGVGESTLGSIRRWTRFIGLNETEFFPYTDASLKLSIKFTNFYKKDAGSFHYPFGRPYWVDINRNCFNDWQYKKYFYPETPIADFVQTLFPAAALFENNKFSMNEHGEFDNFNPETDTAYHFDATKFANWLREKYCIPAGVTHIVGTVKHIVTNNAGIEKLILSDGNEIVADLFVDCTGFKSLLLGDSLQEPFESYTDMLPNNKAWACRLPYKNKSKELEGFTNCTAIGNGWCWNIPLWSRIGTGYVYSDKFVSKEDALDEFKQYLMSDKLVIPRTREEVDSLEYKEITMRVGIHSRTFVKNVVAIGLSAGFIEPLESNGLFSVHEFLFKLIDILERGPINQFDRDMYNVAVREQFDSFAKFVALHYALSHRDDTAYWQAIQDKSFSDKHGDPYFPYVGKTDEFANMKWRYMDQWGHPKNDNKGIVYISTGMNFKMLNARRIQELEQMLDKNLLNEVDFLFAQQEQKRQNWKWAASQSPSLDQFLENTYHKGKI